MDENASGQYKNLILQFDVENIKRQIELSKYSSGIYFVKLVNGEKAIFKKVIVTKAI